MDVLLTIIGLLILGVFGFIAFKLPQLVAFLSDVSKKNNTEDYEQLQKVLSLEFKNLANEIFDEKSKKLNIDNKESLTTILDPLKEKIKAEAVGLRFLKESHAKLPI